MWVGGRDCRDVPGQSRTLPSVLRKAGGEERLHRDKNLRGVGGEILKENQISQPPEEQGQELLPPALGASVP